MKEIEYLQNKVKRIETVLALSQIYAADMNSLFITILTSPGLYNNATITKAFERLDDRQKAQSTKAYEMLKKECPLPEDIDIKTTMAESGIIPLKDAQPVEDQLEFNFPDLDSPNVKDDFEILFDDEDPSEPF